jgi:hypothetical protein
MPTSFLLSGVHRASTNPYGNYLVWETDNGISFQATTYHPAANFRFGGALALKSLVLAVLLHGGFWNFLGLLAVLFPFDLLLYFAFRRVRLAWIEVRPDGFTITPDSRRPKESHFFDRRGIEDRQLEFDTGLTLRYGIHDLRALPAFAIEREFEIFSQQLEEVISRVWHQQNL